MKMKLGKISGNVIKRSVWRQIHTRRNEVKDGAGADCAIFALHEADRPDLATCVQESIVTVHPGELEDPLGEPVRTMRQLITKCANNLAVGGAEPIAVLVTLLLPEETEEVVLKELMRQAEEACEESDLQIAGGQTRVTASVNRPFAVITGYGILKEETIRSGTGLGPDQDIVLSKWIGLEGTAILAARGRDKLRSVYPAYLAEEAAGYDRYLSIIPEAAVAVKSGVCAMHDASEGGILAALWELAEKAGVGLTIDLKKLPIRQETVEVCEAMEVNPYELMSGGCLIMTAEDGAGLVEALLAEGIPATIVGRTTDSRDRLILSGDEVRYMDRPKQDAIYRVRKDGYDHERRIVGSD